MLNSVTVPKTLNTKPATKSKSLRTQIYKLARWLHVYMSTATLLVILFFSITGFFLNHPAWVFGSEPVIQETKGSLHETWFLDGQVDWLNIAETMRQQHGVYGQVNDYWNDDSFGQLTFAAPGYLVDVSIDMTTGDYTLHSESQGIVALMKDLHKGSNTGKSWNWVIDATAIFLTFVSLSGLVLTLLLKKLRVKGLLTMVTGGLMATALLIFSI